jgi:hypothetical protein
MNFLVISRRNGTSHVPSHEQLRSLGAELKYQMANGDVEVAYAFVSNGGAHVINANSGKTLLEKARCHDPSNTELFPSSTQRTFRGTKPAKLAPNMSFRLQGGVGCGVDH